MNEHDEEKIILLQRAAFGREVDEFWGSRIGGYLQDRARECYTAAILELKTVDAEDTKKIRHLQNEVWKAEMVEKWLSEVILDGIKALELLEGNDNEAE